MNARVTALREQAHRQLSSFDADHLAFLALACIKGVGFKTLVAMAAADTRFADAIAIDEEDDQECRCFIVPAEVEESS